jgi:hypothetical protein
VGSNTAGQTVIQLAVNDHVLEMLMTFDAGSEDLEDTDAEPEPDLELDRPPVSGLIEIRPKRLRRAR